MVDWSAGDRRRGGKQDCIWIAHGSPASCEPNTLSPYSRTEAERILRSLIQSSIDAGNGRILVCADFGYGYPAGFASLLADSLAGELPPWRIVWEYLSANINDDIGTKPGRQPSNRSNRFEVANAINALRLNSASSGPFWCVPKAGRYAAIPQRRPIQPLACRDGSIASLRITDIRAKSDTPFRIFGTGSVGSQVLTGIPRLCRIRFGPQFADCSAVWPFETGWAPETGPWLNDELRILHAEIYPSVRAALPLDTIKDRAQVRAMWHWARDLDAKDLLVNEFGIPPGIRRGSPEDAVIRNEEGWILGRPA
jgi:hypothetical protein